SVRGDVHFKLEGGPASGYTVTMPGLLRKVELSILRSPDRLGVLRLNLEPARGTSDVEPELRDVHPFPDTPKSAAFLDARRKVFEAVREQHPSRAEEDDEEEDREGTVETADLLELAPLIDSYATAYADLSESILAGDARGPGPSAAGSLTTLARMDVV